MLDPVGKKEKRWCVETCERAAMLSSSDVLMADQRIHGQHCGLRRSGFHPHEVLSMNANREKAGSSQAVCHGIFGNATFSGGERSRRRHLYERLGTQDASKGTSRVHRLVCRISCVDAMDMHEVVMNRVTLRHVGPGKQPRATAEREACARAFRSRPALVLPLHRK